MKAIIVDNDPLILSLFGHMLNRRGFTVESYTDPTLCPLYAERGNPGQMLPQHPQLVITDFDMPHVNGIEFIEALRSSGYQNLFIALVSGSSIPASMLERATKLGVRFFAKPFRMDHIKAWLDEIEPHLRSGKKGHGFAQ